MITVVNVRRLSPLEMPPTFVYVGRQNGNWHWSPLGNPYRVENFPKPQGAIFAYRRWLWRRLQDPESAQAKELLRLMQIAQADDLQLGCWCHPAPCHADVIKSALEWLIAKA